MPTGRLITGTGQATNPADDDHVTIQIGLRDGKVATASALGMFVGQLIYTAGGQPVFREFETADEASAHGDRFGGCDTARKAARHIHVVFGWLSLDDALAVTLDDLVKAMGGVAPRGRWCAAAILQAVRRALIDIRTRTLAEEIVEIRHARVGG